jgi:hypothetical protein
MSDDTKHEVFVSTATIYKSGVGQPFPPGSEVTLHQDHAESFRKAGLEQKPVSKSKGVSKGE